MNAHTDLKKILKKGELTSELEYQRALIIDRQLRLLVQDHPELEENRTLLRGIIQAYENTHWDESAVTEEQIRESDLAEQIAENERMFLDNRKKAIQRRLKEISLTQKELGEILGHSSQTYISELISGICPFTLNDLVIINKVLSIDMDVLVPKFINVEERVRIRGVVSKLESHVLLNSEDLVFD